MIIRQAKKSDVKNCLLIRKQDKTYWTQQDFEKSVVDKDVVFLTAENKKILGYIIGFINPTKRTEALICETRVDKKERGKRIGTKLVDAFCREAFKKGAKAIYAQIEQKHLAFYRDSCKFKITHRWTEVTRFKK